MADKLFDADRIPAYLHNRGAFANISPEANQRSKPYFSTWLNRERNLIERFFTKLEQFHRAAMLYDQIAKNSLILAQLASRQI